LTENVELEVRRATKLVAMANAAAMTYLLKDIYLSLS
jgi:hypothetical protein